MPTIIATATYIYLRPDIAFGSTTIQYALPFSTKAASVAASSRKQLCAGLQAAGAHGGVAGFRTGKRPTAGAYSVDGTGTLHRETHPTLACRADW
jgi:hypothetical protein